MHIFLRYILLFTKTFLYLGYPFGLRDPQNLVLKLQMVNVAQLVEHRVVVPRVVGSIPTIHPKNSSRDVAQSVAHSLWERGVASSSLAIPTIFLPPHSVVITHLQHMSLGFHLVENSLLLPD